jgi:RNA ligase (TIGR02306 family)
MESGLLSIFKVSVERLDSVCPHPNADRLEIASCAGMTFQFVVLKGKHKVGDEVLYFPVDALLPDSLIEVLGLQGRLAGKQRNRVKTVKLRGQLSQGIVEFPEKILGDHWRATPMEELTARLGVTKYEPEPVACQNGQLMPLPSGVSIYDIEGADRFPEIIDSLLDERVLVTEKLEGSNFSLTRSSAGAIYVCQRRYSIQPVEGAEHDFWKIAKSQGLIDFAQSLGEEMGSKQVTVRGEYLGPKVQSNIYKLRQNRVYLFDILVDGRYLNPERYLALTENMLRAPVLSADKTLRQWLSGRNIQDASNGRSALYDTRREGVVITPWRESHVDSVGRLIIKQRSPEYLARSEF